MTRNQTRLVRRLLLATVLPATAVIGLAVLAPPRAVAGNVFVTNFDKDNNIYTNLNEQYPNTGPGVPGSGVGTPNSAFLFDPTTYTSPNAIPNSNLATNGVNFLLTSNAAGQDFEQVQSAPGQTVVVPVNLQNVSAVYTLMSAYNGTNVTVTFTGGDNASESFTVGIPDFNGGPAINQSFTVNGSLTPNLLNQTVFQVQDTGAGGSGNSVTGSFNTYDLTEQTFILNAHLASETLTSITFTAGGFNPLLLGITAAVPEPSSFTLGLLGIAALAGARRLRRGR